MLKPWQIRASTFHPFMVDAVADLPASVREAAAAAVTSTAPAGDKVARIMYVPSDYRAQGLFGSRMTPEQALIFTEHGLLLVRKGKQGEPDPAPVFVRPETLLYMRSSHLLLYGRMELVSAVNGEAVRLDMEFNAVGWRLMDEEWHTLVSKIIGMPPVVAEPGKLPPIDERVQSMIEPLPLKFQDGLRRYGLYTGEVLQGLVYQPAVWSTQMAVFQRQIIPNKLLALTDASVLILAEERALVRRSQQYGLRIMRIPRAAIAGVSDAELNHHREVIFALARAGAMDERRQPLEVAQAAEWMRLWRDVNGLPAANGANGRGPARADVSPSARMCRDTTRMCRETAAVGSACLGLH